MLIDQDGVPDFWSTLFVSKKLRDQTQSSITSILHNINLFKKWEKINNRNFIEEFEDSKVSSDIALVESIKRHCGLESKHIQKELDQKSKKNINNFGALKLARSSPLSQVSTQYQQRRMHDICMFLLFVGNQILKHKRNSTALLNDLKSLEKTIQANYPISRFSRFGTSQKRLSHAETETFHKFIEVFNPESENNPFKSKALKVRNNLLVQLLFWTGARSGEILSLTLDDIDYDQHAPKVSIHRRHDDKYDSRKYQPVTKTKPREIPIPPVIRDMIDEYIQIRNNHPRSKKHPYLFVSHKGPTAGEPISNSTFYNRVIMPVKAVDREGFRLVKRHGFRHLFNERLSEKIDENNERINAWIAEAERNGSFARVAELKKQLINDTQETQMRMELMGHSSPSSARPYIERHIKKKAKKFHQELMQELSQSIRNARSK